MNRFINELDKRSEKRNKQNNRPRCERQLGSVVNKDVPRGLPNWMIKAELLNQPTETESNETEGSTVWGGKQKPPRRLGFGS